MEVSYKFRIYPNKEQEQQIQKTFGCVRYVYNYFLNQRIQVYKSTGKSPTWCEQSKNLTELKKQNDWLCEPDKCALGFALKDLDVAYTNFFRHKKGFPQFKKKGEHRKTYKTNSNIAIAKDYIKLPKLGRIKCKFSRNIEGRIISATVIQVPSMKYFVSICCTDVRKPDLNKTGKVVGVDIGIKEIAITSDGKTYHNNHFLKKNERKLARLDRRLSKKVKGSKNWEKARIKLARLHEHIANQRRDAIQKMTTELIRENDIICIEDLNVQGMLKNHTLSKAVKDASFYEIRRELEYKAAWYGKTVSAVDRFFPSSQLCSICGSKYIGVRNLTIRKWKCQVCGAQHDRDINAATNILIEGIRRLEQKNEAVQIGV